MARLRFSTSLTFENRLEMVLREQQGGKNVYFTEAMLYLVVSKATLNHLTNT